MSIDAGVPFGAAPLAASGKNKGLAKTFAGIETYMEITYRVDPKVLISKRNLNKHIKVVNRSMMLYWHKHIKPIHFTLKGQAKYKYKRRATSTERIKKKTVRHNKPIVSSGAAESMLDTIKLLTSTPTKARLKMMGPWYLPQRRKRKDPKNRGSGGLSPDLMAEIKTIPRSDAMKMAVMGSKIFKTKLKQDKRRRLGARTVRVK